MESGGGKKVISLISERNRRAAPEELAHVYLKQRAALRALLRRRTGSDDAAEELLQDVWVRVSKVQHEALPENPEGYLQRVAANLALDWLRRHRFRSLLTDANAETGNIADTVPSLERTVQAREAVAYLNVIIAELPPGQRDVFLAYSGQTSTVEAVARRLGIARKTAENQIARAKATIRARMAERGLWP